MKNKEKFFKSKDHMYVFALLHLDGTWRCDILGITEPMYYSHKLALEWYNEISSHMLPSGLSPDDFVTAQGRLKWLYDNMIGE